MTSNISDIKSLITLIRQIPGLIENVLDKLKIAIGLNMTVLCNHITPVWNIFRFFNKEIHHSLKIIHCINKLIGSKCNQDIVKCFKDCLNQIKFKLTEIWSELHELNVKYWRINWLRIETQKIIKCNNEIITLKFRICELIKRYKCSICEFKSIESNIKSIHCVISQLKELKQKLYEILQDIISLICMCSSENGETGNGATEILIISGDSVRIRLECLGQKIDNLFSEFVKIEVNTIELKHLLMINAHYLQISSYILEQLQCIQSNVETVNSKVEDLNKVSSGITVLSNNIKDIRPVIDKMDEQRDDPGYIRDSLLSIISKVCEIKDCASKIKQLQCVVDPLKKIKCSIEKLTHLESDKKCLQIFDMTKTGRLIGTFTCIMDHINIKIITSKLDTVQNGITSLENAVNKSNELEQSMKSLQFQMNYIVGWIDELQNSVDNIVNRFIRCSLQTLSNHIMDKKSSDIVVPEMSNEVANLISGTVIDESIFVLSRIYKLSKIKSEISSVLSTLEKCRCLQNYNKKFKIGVKDIQLPGASNINDNPHLKLHLKNKIHNEENKLCLCLVVRYILLNDLYSVIRFHEHLHMDILSCMSRSYKKYSYSTIHNVNAWKIIILIVTTLDKITLWMKHKFIEGESDVPYTIRCFCRSVNNSYYGYLISIILFVSSLIKNLWSIDPESIRMSIEKLSILISIISQMDVTKVRDLAGSSLSHLGFYDKQVTKHFNIVGSQLHISDSNLQLSITITDDYSKQIYKSDNHCSLLTKPFIQSLISSISNIRISGPKFNLFYQSFTFFSHHILIKSSYSEETKLWISEETKNISEMYLSINSKKTVCNTISCDRKCCENVREKIVYYVICVARGKFRTLSRQITNTAVIKFIQQNNELKLYEIINVLNKLTIDGTQLILRMTKNKLLTSISYQILNNKNIIVSRNWGYESYYEHDVTIVSNHKIIS